MDRKISLFFILILLALVFFNFDVEAQCAMCKQAIKSNLEVNDGSRKVGLGINTGILYLMAVPYLIVATIAFTFYKKQIIAKLKLLIKT